MSGYTSKEVLGKNCRFLQGTDNEQEAVAELRTAIKEQRQCKVLLRNYRKDGTLFWNELTVSPVRSDNGILTHYVGIQSDVTERKKSEEALEQLHDELELRVEERTRQLQATQEQLVRTEKLATLGQLAGGVAHEIRNPLGVIRNAVYFLQQIPPFGDQDVTDALGEISRGLSNSERIVSELLDYARGRPSELSIFPLEEAIDAALTTVKVPKTVSIARPAPSGIHINADRGQIERLLLNLIQNAIQAMPEGGGITILCEVADACVLTKVIDTGNGIEADELEKIFEPLFTKRAKGIGLGLPLCRRYAKQNGGSLVVESEPGKGSTFTITLPISNKNGATN